MRRSATSLLRSLVVTLAAPALLGSLAVATSACSKKTTTPVAAPVAPTPPPQAAIDADPIALLPFGAVVVANLDARKIANGTLGGDMVALTQRVLPFANEVGIDVKRDLDHAYVGAYSFSGADTLVVLTGSFDPAKLEAAAQKGLSTPMGVVVASTYAGRKLYTVANYGYTTLSNTTMLIGTETAIRRALDRVQAGTIKRELAPLMANWVTQSGYEVLVASDVTKQSFGKVVTGLLPWVNGVQYVRIGGRFNPDTSFGVSGALTYPDAQKAASAAQGLGSVAKSALIMGMLKQIGIDPLIRNMTVSPRDNDVVFQSVLDEHQLRAVLHYLTDWIGTSNTPPQLPTPKDGEGKGGGTSI